MKLVSPRKNHTNCGGDMLVASLRQPHGPAVRKQREAKGAAQLFLLFTKSRSPLNQSGTVLSEPLHPRMTHPAQNKPPSPPTRMAQPTQNSPPPCNYIYQMVLPTQNPHFPGWCCPLCLSISTSYLILIIF